MKNRGGSRARGEGTASFGRGSEKTLPGFIDSNGLSERIDVPEPRGGG